jgi:hypothetical protein
MVYLEFYLLARFLRGGVVSGLVQDSSSNPGCRRLGAAYMILANAADFRANLFACGAIPSPILSLFTVLGIADASFQTFFRIHNLTPLLG